MAPCNSCAERARLAREKQMAARGGTVFEPSKHKDFQLATWLTGPKNYSMQIPSPTGVIRSYGLTSYGIGKLGTQTYIHVMDIAYKNPKTKQPMFIAVSVEAQEAPQEVVEDKAEEPTKEVEKADTEAPEQSEEMVQKVLDKDFVEEVVKKAKRGRPRKKKVSEETEEK